MSSSHTDVNTTSFYVICPLDAVSHFPCQTVSSVSHLMITDRANFIATQSITTNYSRIKCGIFCHKYYDYNRHPDGYYDNQTKYTRKLCRKMADRIMTHLCLPYWYPDLLDRNLVVQCKPVSRQQRQII